MELEELIYGFQNMAFMQRSAVTLRDPQDDNKVGLEDVFKALQTPSLSSVLLRVVSSLWRSNGSVETKLSRIWVW